MAHPHWVISARSFEATCLSGNVRHQLPSDVTPLPRTETKSKFLQFSHIVVTVLTYEYAVICAVKYS